MCALSMQSRRLLLAPLLLGRTLLREASAAAATGQRRRRELLELEDLQEKAQASKSFRRFISDPELAREVVRILEPADLGRRGAQIWECNPGPGVLTRTLLDAGACVVALERDKLFLPDLQLLERKADGQLQVLHCDFFKLDPLGQGCVKPPSMYSNILFEKLGMTEVPWTADVPVKVFGLFPDKNEKSMLWKLIYSLYERISIFRYGRIELNMFISEKEYMKLIAGPGEMRNYQAIGVLYQAACDMELLLMEPWSSFLTSSKVGGLGIPKSVYLPNDHLCLVRITPRRDLFSHSLTTANSTTFVIMMKQCFARRTAKLITRLESWIPGHGHSLLRQLDMPENILTGHVSPEQYKRIFEAMEHSVEFNRSWIFEEVLENTEKNVF
ncbi:dimethyladenosine transferase 2, mitochondrial [Ambystoma mexicanum]|uniref:dimethyladenosine transferase 2, mitochondrial n=1 Tax=Ambystoma mexicanum TaxID=8296 RepID=UPI0037E91563